MSDQTELLAALKPFSDFAGILFSLNKNASDPFYSVVDRDGNQASLNVGDFFSIRLAYNAIAAIPSPSPAKGEAEPVAGEPRRIIWYDACSTEDCARPATEYFESGGVGSSYCPECLERIRALASPLPVEAVTVKPLEWREVTEDRGDGYVDATGDYDAVSPIGTFYIQCHGSDSLGWEVSLNGVPLADADSPEAAQAAAQADYESRILSALSPSTLGGDAGRLALSQQGK